jgi:acetyl esterase/lipase
VAVLTAMLGAMASDASATDWSTVQLAWRNDPRPASDAPLPVDAEAPSRASRRLQRRTLRRGIVELDPPAARVDAMIPAALPIRATPAVENAIESSFPLAESSGAAVGPPLIAHRDQAYGDPVDPRQRFDLFLPDGCTGAGLPLVIWIHGPDWKSGSKDDCPIIWLTDDGYAVASIGYRSSDTAVFPAQLDDCLAAVAAITAEASTWGIDATRICLAGSGAGGHLAALVAYTQPAGGPTHPNSTEEVDATAVAAVAMIDAPTHLPSLGGSHDRAGSPASRLVGGPLPEFREAAQRASPLLHVSAQAPPALIVHGGRGDGTALDQGDRLDAALRAAGIESGLVILDAAASDLTPRRGSPAAGALVEFLDRTVGTAAGRHED